HPLQALDAEEVVREVPAGPVQIEERRRFRARRGEPPPVHALARCVGLAGHLEPHVLVREPVVGRGRVHVALRAEDPLALLRVEVSAAGCGEDAGTDCSRREPPPDARVTQPSLRGYRRRDAVKRDSGPLSGFTVPSIDAPFTRPENSRRTPALSTKTKLIRSPTRRGSRRPAWSWPRRTDPSSIWYLCSRFTSQASAPGWILQLPFTFAGPIHRSPQPPSELVGPTGCPHSLLNCS